MEQWEFYRVPGTGTDDVPYRWSWQCRHPDGTVATASEAFRFFLECVSHARLHGYANGPLHTRREPFKPAREGYRTAA